MNTPSLRPLRDTARVFLLVGVAAVQFSPARALVVPVFGPSARLMWSASPDPSVVGYDLYYGSQSGSLTNYLRLGNVTNATVNGTAGELLYFVVTGRDSAGNESPPSNEVSVTMPAPSNTPAVTVGSVLSVATVSLQISSSAAGVNVSASNPVASVWILESSSDLVNWQTVSSGSNSAVNVYVPASATPAVFYRLRGP